MDWFLYVRDLRHEGVNPSKNFSFKIGAYGTKWHIFQIWILRLENNWDYPSSSNYHVKVFLPLFCNIRSSRPEVFCKKGVLRNFKKFTGKHLCQCLFLNKVAGLSPATLLKKRLWHRCFPVNLAKFLRTPFFREHLWWLLFNQMQANLKS